MDSHGGGIDHRGTSGKFPTEIPGRYLSEGRVNVYVKAFNDVALVFLRFSAIAAGGIFVLDFNDYPVAVRNLRFQISASSIRWLIL
ncbi:MAG: hypothetical protein LBR80_10165 [Deltaproteobacteria bacterium]|nr:hypothetical protein [Deltaproteobacteria bacterium]